MSFVSIKICMVWLQFFVTALNDNAVICIICLKFFSCFRRAFRAVEFSVNLLVVFKLSEVNFISVDS